MTDILGTVSSWSPSVRHTLSTKSFTKLDADWPSGFRRVQCETRVRSLYGTLASSIIATYIDTKIPASPIYTSESNPSISCTGKDSLAVSQRESSFEETRLLVDTYTKAFRTPAELELDQENTRPTFQDFCLLDSASSSSNISSARLRLPLPVPLAPSVEETENSPSDPWSSPAPPAARSKRDAAASSSSAE